MGYPKIRVPFKKLVVEEYTEIAELRILKACRANAP